MADSNHPLDKSRQIRSPIDPFKGTNFGDSRTAHLIVLSILAICCLAIFTPVLLHPHWGLYSDPRQIVENCRTFYSSKTFRWDIFQGFYRPGFHMLDLGLWLVSKEQPRGYYLFRALITATTIALTFLSCYKFSRQRLLSALLAISWLFISPAFEVFYTLDKAETYIACLLTIVIFAHVTIVSKIYRGKETLKSQVVAALAIFASSLYAVFTKETGQLELAFGLMVPVSVFASDRLTRKTQNAEWQNTARNQALWLWSWVTCVLCVSAYLIYKAYVAFGGTKATYGAMNVSPAFMWQQLQTYLAIVPDYFVTLAFCLIAALVLLANAVASKSNWTRAILHEYLLASGMTVIAAAGSVVLLSWNAVIAYSWFPLFALLLPAAAFYLSMLTAIFLPNPRIVPCILAISFLLVLPQRIILGQLQYQLDDSVRELTRRVAARPITGNIAYGLPFIRPEYAEVVEEMESLTLSHLIDGYIEKPENLKSLPPRRFFNFVNYNFPQDVTIPKKTSALTEALNQKLKYSRALTYVDQPGVNRFSYWSNDGNYLNWTVDNLRVGDVFLIPYGDVPTDLASFRGTGLFCTDWKTKVAFLPQVEFKEEFDVTRKIFRIGQRRFKIGWKAVSVQSLPQISWFINRAGHLYDGATIFGPASYAGKSLVLTVGMSKAMEISQTETKAVLPVRPSSVGANLVELTIPFSRDVHAGYVSTTLHYRDLIKSDLPGFLAVEKVRVQ